MDEVTIYIEQLSSDDFATKRLAIEVLGEMGDNRALPHLLEIFSDEEWQIRNTAVDAIIKIDKEKAIEPLISLLRDKNASVRNSAISALQLVGEKAVNALKDDVRIFTANTLGFIGATSAVPFLLKCLNAPDLSENVEFATVEALGRIKSYDATLSIIQHLQKADIWDKFNYLNTLGAIGDERATNAVLQCFQDEETLEAAITTAGLIGDDAVVDQTIEAIFHEDNDIQNAAILALFRIKKQVIIKHRLSCLNFSKTNFFKKLKKIDFTRVADNIHEIFSGDDLQLQQAALKLLKFTPFEIENGDLVNLLGKDELLDELIELYQVHPNENIANISNEIFARGEQSIMNFFSLTNSCFIRVSEEIILQALKHPYNEIKTHVIIYCGLQGIFSPKITQELIQFVSSSTGKVAKSAVGALIMNQADDFKKDIAKYLESDNDALKSFALHYIAFNDFKISDKALLAYLDDPSENVRTQAIMAIRMHLHNGTLQKNEFLESTLLKLINDGSERLQHEVISTIEQFLSPALVSSIIPTISGLPYNAKVYGIKTISSHPCSESDDFLIALLEDSHPEIKFTAINAMRKSVSPEKVLPPLIRKMEDFDVDLQGEAIEIIGYIGSREHIPLLETFLKRENWFLKVSSIKAMRHLKDSSAIPSLLKVLEELDKENAFEIVLEALINAFGDLKAVAAVNPLCKFLYVKGLQTTIVRAFLQIGEKDHTPFIELATKGETHLIRLIAVSVLYQKGYNDAAFYRDIVELEEFASVRRAAAEALTLLCEKSEVKQSLASIKDNNDQIIEDILQTCQK